MLTTVGDDSALGISSNEQDLANLDAAQLRNLLLQSRNVISKLKLELQSSSLSSSSRHSTVPSSLGPSSGTAGHPVLPSSHHAYDLKRLAETPTGEDHPQGLVYDLNDSDHDQAGEDGPERSVRSSTPIPNLTINSNSIPTDTSSMTRRFSEDRIETLDPELSREPPGHAEPDPDPEPGVTRKKRPASILGLKRIPSSIVQTTAALHAPSSASSHPPSPSRNLSASSYPLGGPNSNSNGAPTPNTSRPTSPGFPVMLGSKTRKVSGVGTSSGRVIEELQTEVMGVKAGLERTKNDLRLSQRVIGQLTRQNDDLRETKERLRAELEGMNKQMDRKQKLLSEVLERARTAESSVQTHVKDRKALETSTSKSLGEMTLKLQEAQTLAGKSERESIVLREGFLQYKETHKREMAELREEMQRLAEGTRREMEDATVKRNQLVKAIQARSASSAMVEDLLRESRALQDQSEQRLLLEIEALKRDLASDPSTRALQMAESLTEELARMKRLVQANAADESQSHP